MIILYDLRHYLLFTIKLRTNRHVVNIQFKTANGMVQRINMSEKLIMLAQSGDKHPQTKWSAI